MEVDRKRHEEKPELDLYSTSQRIENVANPPSIKGSDVSGRTERSSQHLETDTSFTDNLMDLFEGCRDEMFELKRKNRMQEEQISRLKIEALKWRRVAESYIISWDGIQEEVKIMRAQLEGAEACGKEMREEMELREKEREKMEKRLEEREKEVFAQRGKLELLEMQRREMEGKIDDFEKTQLELKALGQQPGVGGRLISKVNGQSKTFTSQSEVKEHLPRVNASLVNEPVSYQNFRNAPKSRVLPNSVSVQSTTMYVLPSPPKSSGLPKKPRHCARKLIPLHIIYS